MGREGLGGVNERRWGCGLGAEDAGGNSGVCEAVLSLCGSYGSMGTVA